jgi:hypothetical protein
VCRCINLELVHVLLLLLLLLLLQQAPGCF